MKKMSKPKKVDILNTFKAFFHHCNIARAGNRASEQTVIVTPSLTDYSWPDSNKFSVKTTAAENGTTDPSPKKDYLNNDPTRYNVFGVQMISQNLFHQLFKSNLKHINESKVKDCLSNLKKYGLLDTQNTVPNVNLNLPPFEGKDLIEHFYNIAQQQSSDYRNLLNLLSSDIPLIPKNWLLQSGWTRYTEDEVKKVDYPLEDAFVFDTEVCCLEGDLPTLATAVSDKAWYAWVSQDLINGSSNLGKYNYTIDHLIPLESGPKFKGSNISPFLMRPRVVVGHNVSYDRARVKEQYWLERTGLRFVDTLSLHVCVSGVTSYQRSLLKAGLAEDEWSKLSSLNSLSKVHELYCGSEISKQEQGVFIHGTLEDIKNNFQTLVTYCSNDVVATHSVLNKLLPMFLSRFPHPATLAGMLELQCAYIPVNSNWNRYLSESQQAYDDLDMEAKSLLSQSANEACILMHSSNYTKDLWLWDQDWSTKRLMLKKFSNVKLSKYNEILENLSSKENEHISDEVYEKLHAKFASVKDTSRSLPAKASHLPGYPAWYRKLCLKPINNDWVPGPELIGTGMRVAPKLLQLTWKGMPLHFEKGSGWGYMVPYRTDINIDSKSSVPLLELIQHCRNNGIVCSCQTNLCSTSVNIHEIDQTHLIKYSCSKEKKKKAISKGMLCQSELGINCGLVKLPHKDGGHLNVGNPLARDFLTKFSESGLSGSRIFAQRIIEISRMLSYWRNNRERIEKQLVCWLNKKDIPKQCPQSHLGAILPQVVVCGTLTRRAVEPTWMTASNAIVERVGSELRGIIQSPPGFVFVGADVDSQELWIASLLGDSYLAGLHGASPFGWMTLKGQKADGTDMHSVTAKAVGISRNQAKVLNYARIYGAGQKFSERLLKQFNPDMSSTEAHDKASAMFSMTKGKKQLHLKEGVLPNIKEQLFSVNGAKEICNLYKKSLEEVFHPPQWEGGTESAMFNSLEGIAQKPSPETPFLRSKLSRALEPGIDHSDKHISTRINWVVQSGAVDFLHLMLVCMRWLLGPKSRFCLSFHDEVRYLVPNEHKYEAALALHVTNLLTRAFCVTQLGMTDLPQSIAFFSSVEIDQVLRKESNDENKTPSNPHGLSKGYGVPLGESINVYEAIEKAKGVIGIPKVKTGNLKGPKSV